MLENNGSGVIDVGVFALLLTVLLKYQSLLGEVSGEKVTPT
jgi:hypothetical protein